MGYVNGRIPGVALGGITQGHLLKPPARAWNAMNMESQGRYGITLHPTGSMSSYRTLSQQQYLYHLYQIGRGNLAATPGTSNHGWGLAVDLATPQMRGVVDKCGAHYGWAKRWSDAQSEWWHIKYRSGVWSSRHRPWGLRTLRHGSRGRDVVALKSDMYRAGIRSFERSTPSFGPNVVNAVKRFQHKHNMHSDGVVGPKTWHKIRS
jgi:hypothetical protein